MTDTPLAGLNIVITRPREQAVQLQQHVETLGGTAILFPLLEITPVTDTKALHEAVARLSAFDLAIFISPNAVRYSMAAIRSTKGLPARLRIATVGQGSAQALRDLGVKDIIAPQDRFDSEALLALPALQNVQDWKIAIFRGDGGRELLGDTLKARGATVEYITCYQRGKPPQGIDELLQKHIDAITLSSSEALGYLHDMLAATDKARLLNVPLFVPHARITEKARQQGWQTVLQTEGGDDGIVSGLVAWAQKTQTIGTSI